MIRRQLRALASAVMAIVLAMAMLASGAAATDWPVFNYDPAHSGNNVQETLIRPDNIHFVFSSTPLFKVSLPNVADGAPVALSGIQTPQGTRNFIFLTTKDGHILALDAYTGKQIWSRQYPAGSCRINNGSSTCYTTSSPAIDPNQQFVYSYGLDGKVHKLQVADGTEVTTGGWPEVATLKNFEEKGSSALSVGTAASGTSYLYVANGGYPGDGGDYQGHLTSINLNTGTQNVFNINCSDQTVHFVERPGTPDCPAVQSAVWARPGVIYDRANDRIFLSTGNGNYAPASRDWGDSVLALNPDGTGLNGRPLDSYTPANFAQLQNGDTDLGSTAPAILPVPSSSSIQNLAVQGGKDGLLRLLNLDNLSGQGGPGHIGGEIGAPIRVPQGCEVLTQPTTWVNPADQTTWVFVSNGCGLSGLKVTVAANGTPSLVPAWQSGDSGSSTVMANGVLFQATINGGVVRALDPVTGAEQWSGPIGGIHWESPTVVNGVVYISDERSNLTAYSGQERAFLPALSNGAYGGYVSAITVQAEASPPAAPAYIGIRYFDQSGESVGTGDIIAGLPVNGSATLRQDNGHAFPPSGAGSAVIVSDQPVFVIVNEFAPGNRGDGTAYTPPTGQAGPQFAPAIANAAYGGYTTGIGLLNVGSAPTTMTITYRDGGGAIVKTQTLPSIPPHAYRAAYSGNSGSPDDAQLPAGFAGTATITTDNNSRIAGVVNETGPGGQLSSYGLTRDAAQTHWAPAALNNAYGGFYTGMGIQNATATAGVVTMNYYDASGVLAASHALPIAANGYLGVYQGDPAQGPPASSAGYTASISSTVNVAAIVNEVAPVGTGAARQSSAYNTAVATNGAQLPLVENSGPDGWSTGEGVMNIGTTATTVTLTYYDPSTGTQIGSPVTQTVQPNAFWGPYQPTAGLSPGIRAAAVMSTSAGGLVTVICNEQNSSTFMTYVGDVYN